MLAMLQPNEWKQMTGSAPAYKCDGRSEAIILLRCQSVADAASLPTAD
jgi:hypothetical protein